MTETIRGLPEIVITDADPNALDSDAIGARTRAAPEFVRLGPPDLCVLYKSVRQAWVTGIGDPAAEQLNFFHYVVGLDITDSVRVSQYIIALIDAQESTKKFAISKLWNNSTWKIHGGLYCSWDAFHRVDVRIDVRIPGCPGVRAYAIGEDGVEVEATREIWEGVQLSAMLRSLEPPGSSNRTQHIPNLRSLPTFTEADIVVRFIKLAEKYFHRGDELGHTKDIGSGTHSLSEIFCSFLIGSRRLKQAIEVFSSLSGKYPTIVLHIARAYMKRNQLEAALSLLARSLKNNPQDSPVLHYQAKLLLKMEVCPELAVKAAELATEMDSMIWRYWATLAQAYLQNFQYEEALLVLNASPFLLEDEFKGDEVLGLPNLQQAEQTVPQEDSKENILWMKPDGFLAGPKDILSHVSFSGFGERFGFHPKLDDSRLCSEEVAAQVEGPLRSSENNGNNLTPPESAAYKVLVGMYNDLGWDNLLTLRAQVFFMEEDEEEPVEYDAIVALGRQSRDNQQHMRQRLKRLIVSDSGKDPSGSGNQIAGSKTPPRKTQGRGPFAKRVCSRVLDKLFQVLYNDLTLFQQWCSEPDGPNIPGNGTFWMYRGMLAERLHQDDKAEYAFRLCQARSVCPRASVRLLKLYMQYGGVAESLAQLAVLCAVVSNKEQAAPDWLSDRAARLVCRFGLKELRAVVAERLPRACQPWQAEMVQLLNKAEQNQVYGYDK